MILLRGFAALRLFLLLLLFLSPPLVHSATAQPPQPSVSDDADYNFEDNTGNVNPSLAVIIIVIVSVFLATAFISLYIHQCGDHSTVSSTPVTAFGLSRRGNVRGIEQTVIETFPTFLYSEVKELKVGKETLECAVCLNEFEENETLRLLPKCDHVFHSECIDAWLAGHSTCPVCRANLHLNPSQPDRPPESIHELGSDHHEQESSSQETAALREVRIAIEEQGERKENGKTNGKYPRSHSTGHSLSQTEEGSWERYTLKLPAELRRQLVARQKLKRTTSLVALPRVTSSRRGYRGGGEGSGSSRYGGVFGRSLSRMVSFRWMSRPRTDGQLTESSRGS